MRNQYEVNLNININDLFNQYPLNLVDDSANLPIEDFQNIRTIKQLKAFRIHQTVQFLCQRYIKMGAYKLTHDTNLMRNKAWKMLKPHLKHDFQALTDDLEARQVHFVEQIEEKGIQYILKKLKQNNNKLTSEEVNTYIFAYLASQSVYAFEDKMPAVMLYVSNAFKNKDSMFCKFSAELLIKLNALNTNNEVQVRAFLDKECNNSSLQLLSIQKILREYAEKLCDKAKVAVLKQPIVIAYTKNNEEKKDKEERKKSAENTNTLANRIDP